MTTTVQINRPWLRSFNFTRVPFSDTAMDQFHKLCRNYVASLDLGCPSAKHVKSDGSVDLSKMSERERYLQWVKNWKEIYQQLSCIIRTMKAARRTIRHPTYTAAQKDQWTLSVGDKTNQTMSEYMRQMSAKHLERLQETAMVLLNARWNAKLAAGMRRQLARQHNGNASDSNSEDAGSTPAEPATPIAA